MEVGCSSEHIERRGIWKVASKEITVGCGERTLDTVQVATSEPQENK